MPLYNYQCPQHGVFEAFHDYGEHKHSSCPGPRDVNDHRHEGQRCGLPSPLVWVSGPALGGDINPDVLYRRQVEARGGRKYEPGVDRDVDNNRTHQEKRKDQYRRNHIEERMRSGLGEQWERYFKSNTR